MSTVTGTSASTASLIGRPFSIASRLGQSSTSATRSASCQRRLCRSASVVRRQLGNARRAASTAASTSESDACATFAHSLPVLGSTAAKVDAGTDSSPPTTMP